MVIGLMRKVQILVVGGGVTAEASCTRGTCEKHSRKTYYCILRLEDTSFGSFEIAKWRNAEQKAHQLGRPTCHMTEQQVLDGFMEFKESIGLVPTPTKLTHIEKIAYSHMHAQPEYIRTKRIKQKINLYNNRTWRWHAKGWASFCKAEMNLQSKNK
ncbi:Avi_7169 family alkylhydroperoxidase domain-containing protein [Striga asiatica]|uniref:Avi_7169 family alkylhydroperoxidase domain-containing protein n=1 Tax=Striga asiatica TaxID=4170 RepID=A0A5A7Q7P2_STRAF|nr:Avi_7169 family alkylhydroperoxidase domain-containing protein [Striga asiatica]